jgi:hypothetical protein
MAIWISRLRFLRWPFAWRVWCTRCQYERVGLRLTRGAAGDRAIAVEAEHFVQCPARERPKRVRE